MTKAGRWLAAFLGLALVGCGSRGDELPPLYPVTGRVLKNGQPVQGGGLRFELLNEQAVLIVTGTVGEDGRFELSTRKGRSRGSGAPEGIYNVTYTPPSASRGTMPVTSREKYKVEAKATELTFEIGGGKPF